MKQDYEGKFGKFMCDSDVCSVMRNEGLEYFVVSDGGEVPNELKSKSRCSVKMHTSVSNDDKHFGSASETKTLYFLNKYDAFCGIRKFVNADSVNSKSSNKAMSDAMLMDEDGCLISTFKIGKDAYKTSFEFFDKNGKMDMSWEDINDKYQVSQSSVGKHSGKTAKNEDRDLGKEYTDAIVRNGLKQSVEINHISRNSVNLSKRNDTGEKFYTVGIRVDESVSANKFAKFTCSPKQLVQDGNTVKVVFNNDFKKKILVKDANGNKVNKEIMVSDLAKSHEKALVDLQEYKESKYADKSDVPKGSKSSTIINHSVTELDDGFTDEQRKDFGALGYEVE